MFGAVDPLIILDPSDDQSWTTHVRQSSPCGMLRTSKLLFAVECIESDASLLGKPAPGMLQIALGAAASRLSDVTYPPQDLAHLQAHLQSLVVHSQVSGRCQTAE